MSAGNVFLSIVKGVLIFFGALFILLIIAISYLFIADPFDLKKYFTLFSSKNQIVNNEQGASSVSSYDNPLLSDEQEETLRNIGVDPASLPTEVTPEMEKCFTDALGSQRVGEIVAGDSPTALELLKAKSCL